MDFRKGIILVKVDEMYNILKRLVIGREMKVELDGQSFCLSLPVSVQTFTTPLLC